MQSSTLCKSLEHWLEHVTSLVPNVTSPLVDASPASEESGVPWAQAPNMSNDKQSSSGRGISVS
jgi:hypothetical protein